MLGWKYLIVVSLQQALVASLRRAPLLAGLSLAWRLLTAQQELRKRVVL